MDNVNTLSFKDHKPCIYYTANKKNGFRKQILNENESIEFHKGDSNLFLFGIEGDLIISDSESSMELTAGTMSLCTSGDTFIHLKSSRKSVLMILKFKNLESLILEYMLQKGSDEIVEKVFAKTIFTKEMHRFLMSIDDYICADIYCQHLHDLKIEEFFRILAIFHGEESYVSLLGPLRTSNRTFRYQVLSNFRPLMNVIELAEKCNMSVRNFSRRFTEEFGVSPGKWIADKKDGQILQSLSFHDAEMNAISEKFGFASPSHFTNYCKKKFKDTPKGLHQKLSSFYTPLDWENSNYSEKKFSSFCLRPIKI
ncbi:MAG: helix-turn-helix domain-containing protein [Macellibacteroides fermentans]|uniref:helix-turn-helix domain-containing protein n=1 Tax=Macellibacteroides fermentans TaxID=879969 RepID=UPI003AC23AAB